MAVLPHLLPLRWPRFYWGALCFVFAAAVAHATSVVPPRFTELVAEAQVIVRAKVTQVACVWVDTPQGRVIKTNVTLTVARVMKGTADKEMTLQFLGGEIDDQVMRVAGMPQFTVGQTDIVFITGNGVRFCPLVGMMHGRYRVKTDASTQREFIARDDGVPLEDVSEVQLQQNVSSVVTRSKSAATALTPEVFEQKIKEEASRRAALP